MARPFCSQHAPGSAAPVHIQGYVVQWSQGGQNRAEWRVESGGHTRAEVSVDAGQHDITVQAVVLTGSAVPAHITVPQSDDGGEISLHPVLASRVLPSLELFWLQRHNLKCAPLSRNRPSEEAVEQQRRRWFQPVLARCRQRNLWLHRGVVRPGTCTAMYRRAMAEGARGKQYTCPIS